jgi:hypothetical protein
MTAASEGNIPEDSHLHARCRENLKSHIIGILCRWFKRLYVFAKRQNDCFVTELDEHGDSKKEDHQSHF